jgi:hypothetical protein
MHKYSSGVRDSSALIAGLMSVARIKHAWLSSRRDA